MDHEVIIRNRIGEYTCCQNYFLPYHIVENDSVDGLHICFLCFAASASNFYIFNPLHRVPYWVPVVHFGLYI